MSTPIYNEVLYNNDIWDKKNLVKIMEEQLENVRNQLNNDCDLIEIHICGITIDLDYIENELTITV